MKKVRLYHDKKGNTLTIWFDDPKKESVSEEIGGDIVVMKDDKGNVVGVEKLNYSLPYLKFSNKLPVEILSV